MRQITLTIGQSLYDKECHRREVSWEQFVKRLEGPRRTNESVEQFLRMSKEQQAKAKDRGVYVVGTFSQGRKRRDLVSRDAICLDMDHAGANWRETLYALRKYAYVAHTTRKHAEDAPRIRIVVPLSRSISAAEYAPAARMIASKMGINHFDDTTYDAGRVMYWPTASKDSENYERIVGESEDFIDVDKVLALYDDWKDATEWPLSSREKSAPRTPSGRKAVDPRTKSGVVGAFCRVYDIHAAISEFLSDRYETCGDRYTFIEGTTAGGLVVYDDGLFAHSHHEHDPVSGRTVNAFDLVRLHLHGDLDDDVNPETPIGRHPSYIKFREQCLEIADVKLELIKMDADDGFDPTDGFTVIEDGEDPAAPADTRPVDPKWKAGLAVKGDRIISSLPNIKAILSNDERLRAIDLRYDLMRERPVGNGTVPWDETRKLNNEQWRDEDDLGLRVWLETRFKLSGEVSGARMVDAITSVAWDNRFHPIKDWLETLKWDGEPRLDTMLVDFLGAADNEYTRAVSRKWLTGAVARIMKPGCKFDYMLVLESPKQGIGKSTFGAVLAGEEWFNDDMVSMQGKEAIEALQGSWIIELAELHTFSKSEVEHIKAFISRRRDKMRPAYGRRIREFDRQCVFLGTTNEETYLKDASGNRRFWPVLCRVNRMDVDKLRAEREQLLAEAVHRYDSGEPLYLEDAKVEERAIREQSLRFSASGLAGLIELYLDQPIHDDHYQIAPEDRADMTEPGTVQRERICLMEIWECGLDGRRTDLTPQKRSEIFQAMRQVSGWRRMDHHQSFGRFGKRERGWERI